MPLLDVFKPLSGAPKPRDYGAAVPKVRMKNIFAAPLDEIKKDLDDLKSLFTPKSDAQYAFINDALSHHFVFQHLEQQEKKRLIDAMSLKSVEAGNKIITQGEKGEYLYVIYTGRVEFLVDGDSVGTGEAGTIFGELSLLYDCPTAASVIATSKCKLWRVSQYTFRRIKAAHELSNDDEARKTIQSISFFKDLEEEYIRKLADSLFERKFKKGDVLTEKGQEGDTLYILKEGWLQATDVSVGSTKYADVRLGPGDYFGEGPIVTGNPVAATVTCLTDGVAYIMTKQRFQQCVGHLNLRQAVLKGQDSKLLKAVPLFAYSDIDSIEIDLMAAKIQEVDFQKGDVIANIGQSVVPAVYIIRSGVVTLSNGNDAKELKTSEVFGFGDETLIVTNALKQQQPQGGLYGLLDQARAYLGEQTLKQNSVVAMHNVTVTEDAKLGMLALEDARTVLHDLLRLGRSGSGQDASITTDSLEKRKVLGAGTFGTVWLTRYTKTDSAYALKVQYKRELIEYGQAKGVIREKNVMARMHHPFVMSIVNSEQDETCLYMVMDLMQGGELGSVMSTKAQKFLPEDKARFYAACMLEGLSYMHRRNYVYRDLKGENVLLDNDGYAVIVDLGFAKFVPDKTFTFCGTPLFIAPEVILSKGHDKSADVWSYGVLLYEMMTGENPFYDGKMDQMTLFKKIVGGKWTFPKDSKLTPEARDLMLRLIVADPKERLGCLARADLDIRDHAWFDGYDFGALYRKEITPPWVPKVSSPFDGTNFQSWSDLETKEHDTTPLTPKEQALFSKF